MNIEQIKEILLPSEWCPKDFGYSEKCGDCQECWNSSSVNLAKIHSVKTLPKYFKDVLYGLKTFTIRKNDRDYKVKDFLIKQEFDGENYTGRELLMQITYITDYEQKDGYVVMGLKIIEEVSE